MSTNDTAVVELQQLLPCGICGRTFLPGPLQKHSRVCERNATRKRKVFDSLKQRVEGTDLAPFHQKSYLKKQEPPIPVVDTRAKQSKWKEKHLELVNAIRAAKAIPSQPVSVSKKSSALVMSSPNERCPSCDRQFGPKAFDRHVEWCKEHKSRIQKSPANVLMAKERLEARTKYKVPPLNKSRRTLTREKYSPTMSRTESVTSIKSNSSASLERSPSVRKPKSVVNFKRNNDKELLHNSKSEKFVREPVDKCSEGVRKDIEKIGVKDKKLAASESVKCFHMKNLKTKLNTIEVNSEVEGLTVSKISRQTGEETPKKLVTWKETVLRSHSDNHAMLINLVSPSSEVTKKLDTDSIEHTKMSEGQRKKCDKKTIKRSSEPSLAKPPFYKDIHLDLRKNEISKFSRESSFSRESDGLNYIEINGPTNTKGHNFEDIEKSIVSILKNDPILQQSKIPVYKDSYKSSRNSEDDLDECECHLTQDDLKIQLRASKHGSELIEETIKLLHPKRTSNSEVNFYGAKPVKSHHNEKEKFTHKSVLDKYKVDGTEFMDAYNLYGKKHDIKNGAKNYEPETHPGDPCCSYSNSKTTFKALSSKNNSKSTVKMIIKKSNTHNSLDEKITLKQAPAIARQSPDNHICSGKSSDTLCEACKQEFISCGIISKKLNNGENCQENHENVLQNDANLNMSSFDENDSNLDDILPPPCQFNDDWPTLENDEISNSNPSKEITPKTSTCINLIEEFNKKVNHSIESSETPIEIDESENYLANTKKFNSIDDLYVSNDSLDSLESNSNISDDAHEENYRKSENAIDLQSFDRSKDVLDRFKSPIKVIPSKRNYISARKSNLSANREDNEMVRGESIRPTKSIIIYTNKKIITGDDQNNKKSFVKNEKQIGLRKTGIDDPGTKNSQDDGYKLKNVLPKNDSRDEKIVDETVIRKLKVRNSNVIFLNKNCNQNWELDSLDGQSSNPYNEVLSTARIHRRLRKCCSDIGLSRLSEFNFTSYTEIDLCKNLNNSNEIIKKPDKQDLKTFIDNEFKLLTDIVKKDKVLELGGEKFLASLQRDSPPNFDKNSIANTSTPKNSVSSISTDYIPRKRRKLNSTFDLNIEEGTQYDFNDYGCIDAFACGDMKRDMIENSKSFMEASTIELTDNCTENIDARSGYNLHNLDSVESSERIKSVPVFKFGQTAPEETIINYRPIKSAEISDSNSGTDLKFAYGSVSMCADYSNLLMNNIKKIKDKRHQVNFGSSLQNGCNSPRDFPVAESTTVSEGHFERYFYSEPDYEEQEITLVRMEKELDGFKRDIENYAFQSTLNSIEEHSEKIDSCSSGVTNLANSLTKLNVNKDSKTTSAASLVPSILDYPEPQNFLKPSIRIASTDSLKFKKSRPASSSLIDGKNYFVLSVLSPRLDIKSTILSKNTEAARESKHQLLQLNTESSPKDKEFLKLPKIVNEKVPMTNKKKNHSEHISLPNISNVKTKDFEMKESSEVGKDDGKSKLRFRNITLMKGSDNSSGGLNCFERGDSLECRNIDGSLDQNPSIIAVNRQLMELFGDDIKSASTALVTINKNVRPNTTNNTPIKNNVPNNNKKIKSADMSNKSFPKTKTSPSKKRASVIDPPTDFQDGDSYNDSFEMLENLINDNYLGPNEYKDEDILNLLTSSYNEKTRSYISENGDNLSLSAVLNERKYSDDMSSIDPLLINENDNLSIPEHFKPEDSSPTSLYGNNSNHFPNNVDHYSVEYDKKFSKFEQSTPVKNKSSSKHSRNLKHSISLLDDVESLVEEMCAENFIAPLEEIENYAKSVSKSIERKTSSSKLSKLPKKDTQKSSISLNSSLGISGSNDRKKNLNSLKRSISLLDPVANPRSLKSKEDIENYFDEHDQKGPKKVESTNSKEKFSTIEKEDPVISPALKPEELFSVDDEMYEEYKKYEQMYLQEKEERMKKEEKRPSEVVTGSEDDDHLTVKISGDSAYGRRTPKVRARATKLAPLDSKKSFTRVESPSSSGSETSPVYQSPTPDNHRMSKFCHECGNKYPVTSAKFCVECGVRRLVL